MIEVHDVIVQCMSNEDEVANVLRIGRNLQRERIFDGAYRGHSVNRRANTTETLRKYPAFARIAAAQNLLQSTPHGAARPGFLDRPTVDLNIDTQVPFNTSDRVDRDAGHQNPPLAVTPTGAEGDARIDFGFIRGHGMGRKVWSQVPASPGRTAK